MNSAVSIQFSHDQWHLMRWSINTAIYGNFNMDRVKRIWYLSPMRAAKVQASLRIRAVSPEPPLLAHTSSESRGTFRQKARSLAPLNGLACAVKICHDGMLEDTNSLDGAHMLTVSWHCELQLSCRASFLCNWKLSEICFFFLWYLNPWERWCKKARTLSHYFTHPSPHLRPNNLNWMSAIAFHSFIRPGNK